MLPDGSPAVFTVDFEKTNDSAGRYHSSGLKDHEQTIPFAGAGMPNQIASSSVPALRVVRTAMSDSSADAGGL